MNQKEFNEVIMVCHTKTDADRMIFLNLVQNVPNRKMRV